MGIPVGIWKDVTENGEIETITTERNNGINKKQVLKGAYDMIQ